jgi:hypothetical protein
VRGKSFSLLFSFSIFSLLFLPDDVYAQHGQLQVPAAIRFPKVERPPVPPAGFSDLPHAAVLLPAGHAAQVFIPPQGQPTLPGSPAPSDEEPQSLPDGRFIETTEEVLQAQVQELDHVLREALDRLADADQRITQLEADSTRFRDNALPVMESRIAPTERLTVTVATRKPR